ncbi:hypothetical protein ACX9MO_13080 [Pseudooceanicola sp. 502str34]|uniref:hypothetical protein n=1 Tax=Maritimibacter alkaliphilus TaxID=404236 RepID=UPI001C976A95|nr:hypothetical protein [Maritimibacter alkaliphilus]MBY6088865.1 DUF1127 domain-containing protein [Maritimibacter alkaliphilus]
MALATNAAPARGKLDNFFAAIGQGFNAYLERRARIDQIHALNQKSDDELAKLGITRDEIPAYVFRDLFYL